MIGYLDCSTGVSGDKLLGALLDAGRDDGRFTVAHVERALVAIAPEARVIAEKASSHGIAAISVSVDSVGAPPLRTYAHLRESIGGADVPEPVRHRALNALELLAAAESNVHGCAIDDVHFHEIGALDTVMDVLGTCLGLHALGIESLVCSPVAVGAGTVSTSHGVLAVPAPATAALLVCVPTVSGPTARDGMPLGELTTPTGAALVRACADDFGAWPAITPALIGYGMGTRDIGCANVCRIVVGEATRPFPVTAESVTLLESNIDHISPEAAAFAAEQLLGEGALDVWTSPIVMKKGRSAVTLSALADSPESERLAQRMMALTGTLGVRSTALERLVAGREEITLATPYGDVRYKHGPAGMRAEADDIARIARDTSRGFADVADELAEFGRDA